MPRVSIVLPVYAAEETIAEALHSALCQRFADREIIVVSDGSPDRSLEICRRLGGRRIEIIEQGNRGVSAARNAGIRRARGEYIALLDSDDRWLPDKLARQVRFLEQQPRVGVSYCQAAMIDRAGRPVGLLQVPKLCDIRPADVLCNTPVKNGSCPLIRKEALEAVRFMVDDVPCYFDESFRCLEDVECWLRILINTPWQLAGIPDVLVHYRVGGNSLSAEHQQMEAAMQQLLKKLATYAPPGFSERLRAAAVGYLLRHQAQRELLHGTRRGQALYLMLRALRRHPAMFIEDLDKTLLTLFAAEAKALLPQPAHELLLRLGLRAAGVLQRRNLLRDS